MRWLPLLLVAAASASPPPQEGEWKSPNGNHRFVIEFDRRYSLYDGDKLLVNGELSQPPEDVFVLSREPSAVLFEKYFNEGFGDTLALLGADGKLRWRLSLEEAIPGGSGGAEREERPARILWCRAWWVDEPRDRAVLVARNGTISEVDLKTGKAAKAPKEVILDAFALPWARDVAIEVAIEREIQGLRAAAEKLLPDPCLAPTTGLLVAVAVEKGGGPRVSREVWEAALADGPTESARRAVAFAGKHVADLDLLVKTAVRKDALAYYAVAALGDRGAVDELAGLLNHGSIEPGVRDRAAKVLGEQAAEKVIDAIDKQMEDAGAAEGGALLTAALATGASGLERRFQHHESVLLKVLDKETADVGWLADYFRGRPTSEAVQPLLRSLAKHQRDPGLRRRIIAALKPCSGEDHGDDAGTWIKALGRR